MSSSETSDQSNFSLTILITVGMFCGFVGLDLLGSKYLSPINHFLLLFVVILPLWIVGLRYNKRIEDLNNRGKMLLKAGTYAAFASLGWMIYGLYQSMGKVAGNS